MEPTKDGAVAAEETKETGSEVMETEAETAEAKPEKKKTAKKASSATPKKASGSSAPIKTAGKQVLTGTVVSDKMEKTIVVAVAKRTLHALYKKYVNETKKVKVHDEQNDARTGDTVRVVQSRPMSKEKRWRLLEIVERAR